MLEVKGSVEGERIAIYAHNSSDLTLRRVLGGCRHHHLNTRKYIMQTKKIIETLHTHKKGCLYLVSVSLEIEK